MKIFQAIQKDWKVFGIASDQHQFNWRNVVSLSNLFVGIVSVWIYFFNEAKSFHDYANAIFMAVVLIAIFVIFIIIVLEMPSIFDCINDAEQIIDSREYN